MFTRRDRGMGRISKRMRLAVALLLLALGSGVPVALTANAQIIAQVPRDHTYIPLIPSGGSVATPTPTVLAGATPGQRVYGLLGRLEQPVGRRYTYYLRTADNRYYALAGQTPEIEQQIDLLAREGEYSNVKVWGEVQAATRVSEDPLIVVTGVLGTEASLPTAVAAASIPVPVALVKFDEVNLYSGPSSSNEVVGKVVRRQACEVTGRNQARTWLQLTCADGQQGWIDARLVEVQGNVAIVLVVNPVTPTPVPTVPAATPTPTPTPVVFSGWRTELFNNGSLAGVPVAVLDVSNINFNWGAGAPSPLPADGFSIRFSRRISVIPAYYQFTATADDGVRIWVDGRMILNAWPANPSQTYRVGQVLTSNHDIRVEYYEQSGLANVRVDFGAVSENSVWQASYYYGASPLGSPAFQQQEPRGENPLDYNWSLGSPYSNTLGPNVLGNDYWSARWQGEFPFDSGNYVFRAAADDGVRLYLNGLLVLDHWRDGYKDVGNRVLGVGPGEHTIVVEYYERTGNASIRVWWYRDGAYLGPQ
jgi:hypothetical protein